MMDQNLDRMIASMKGLAGSGNILSETVRKLEGVLRTLEPGDIVRSNPPMVSAAPLATDLWYLYAHMNFLNRYYDVRDGKPVTAEQPDVTYAKPDGDHAKYLPYLAANLSFLSLLTGLKPLKVLRDLNALGISTQYDSVFDNQDRFQYENNGIYWINLMAFEVWTAGKGAQYPSDGPKNINDYVGYLTFPIGQLGVQEVVSLLQETALSGYKFTAVDQLDNYLPKTVPTLEDRDKPSVQNTPEIFPEMKDAGKNYCFGRHLIESAYVVPDVPAPSQNRENSSRGSAYAPTPKRDVELFSKELKDYGEDVKPKLWMRYWIHRDSTLPVPGEFIGILCRPVACPPHVWWFQESAPFVYAGNWMETGNLTSGVITAITLEAARTDGGTGSQYTVKIQGCTVLIDATDFASYSVGDRVAVLKVDSTTALPDKSFTWASQPTFKSTDAGQKQTKYVIAPLTYYKKAA